MAALETLTFVVAHEDVEEFLDDLRVVLEDRDVAELLGTLREEAPPLENTAIMRSEVARVVGITLTSSGLVGAVARVLVERIRAHKRDVHVIDKDGNEVILAGDFDLAEIVEILNRAVTNGADSSE